MSRVEYAGPALIDLLAVWKYIARHSAHNADGFLDQIETAINTIVAFPNGGHRRADIPPPLRFIPVGDYLIIYRPLDDGLRVLCVIHGSHRIPRGILSR